MKKADSTMAKVVEEVKVAKEEKVAKETVMEAKRLEHATTAKRRDTS